LPPLQKRTVATSGAWLCPAIARCNRCAAAARRPYLQETYYCSIH